MVERFRMLALNRCAGFSSSRLNHSCAVRDGWIGQVFSGILPFSPVINFISPISTFLPQPICYVISTPHAAGQQAPNLVLIFSNRNFTSCHLSIWYRSWSYFFLLTNESHSVSEVLFLQHGNVWVNPRRVLLGQCIRDVNHLLWQIPLCLSLDIESSL